MQRAYYQASIEDFLAESTSSVLGKLFQHHHFSSDELQKNAWIAQIEILKQQLVKFPDSDIAFEYSIPRMGKRVDVIVLADGIVYVLEFKVGDRRYTNSAQEQVLDYAIDLKNFHQKSHDRTIVPILVSTEAPANALVFNQYEDGVCYPIKANKDNLSEILCAACKEYSDAETLDSKLWFESTYKPTPTIVEAAQALYQGHSVQEITRSDSGAINLGRTSEAIAQIIDYSKQYTKKSICFLTGVPGAGKTLAGLNIANERHNIDEGEHAVFLSGNGPLVKVLQESLARNKVQSSQENKHKITIKSARSETNAFIQNVHHFRDDVLQNQQPPVEKVAVFDEAQRAWTQDQTSKFMKQKKGIPHFDLSEPEFLISAMDRHSDWAVVICLIGGGQEINTGEAGLPEWFHAIHRSYPHWDVYVSDKLLDFEYTNGEDIYSLMSEDQLNVLEDLHLAVSVRSFRSEKLSAFVKSLLELNLQQSRSLFNDLQNTYPIVVTRHIHHARKWLREKARGSEGLGIVASSGAYRLKPIGIHVKAEVDPPIWFLNEKDDVRSSGFLEEVATEFDIQGLELDWTCVAWDANLRLTDKEWSFKKFSGTKWQNINDQVKRRYLLNSYRVLLTRARQGMAILVPEGDPEDQTRLPEFYDPVFHYLVDIGLQVI